MRIFKYLAFTFLFLISINSNAAYEKYKCSSDGSIQSTMSACANLLLSNPSYSSVSSCEKWGGNGFRCLFTIKTGGTQWTAVGTILPAECPAPGYPVPVFFETGTAVPIRVCQEIAPNKFCSYSGSGDPVINTPTQQMVTLQSDSFDPVSSCTRQFRGQCDKTDPYGGCYQPPNDGCTRISDGSIICPEGTPPPQPDDTCNGATYCKRPPEGCGKGYVSGSFNGQQLCVKSGPSDPDEPEDPDEPQQPNQCTASYCPKPDQGKDCPEGYYTSTYNGQKICVKDNPNPNQPNPNDPNNNDGGDDGGGASEPNGGDDGSTGSVNLKPVIDAINSLKAALLTAFETLSRKLSSLVDGQKESNEHLKNIKSESVKTNEKLDTSNVHLDKIEEATQATSEAVGETNKKLDGIKDAVDGIGKCKNPSYDPTNLNSVKYFECSANELGLTDTPFEIKQEQITEFQREDHIKFGQHCPFTKTVEDVGYFKFEKDLTFICEFGNQANPYIRAIGYLGALIYLLIALRSKS